MYSTALPLCHGCCVTITLKSPSAASKPRRAVKRGESNAINRTGLFVWQWIVLFAVFALVSDWSGTWQQRTTKRLCLNFCGDAGRRLWWGPPQQGTQGVSLKMNKKGCVFAAAPLMVLYMSPFSALKPSAVERFTSAQARQSGLADIDRFKPPPKLIYRGKQTCFIPAHYVHVGS